MSSENKEEQPQRHAWSLHLDHENYFLDEPITGWVELFVQDVYMAAKIQLTLMQFVLVTVSDKYARKVALKSRVKLNQRLCAWFWRSVDTIEPKKLELHY